MRVGTKSLILGAHQFVLHPALVALAWRRIYGEWPTARDGVAISVHDWGYFGVNEMDGSDGKLHPRFGAWLAGRLAGSEARKLCEGHSRGYAKIRSISESKLCAPDKLASTMVPKRLYLLMTMLTGEVFDFIEDVQNKEEMASYKKNPARWYDDIIGPGGVMFRQAMSLAAKPNALDSEPLEPFKRHPRSWVTLLCDWLVSA